MATHACAFKRGFKNVHIALALSFDEQTDMVCEEEPVQTLPGLIADQSRQGLSREPDYQPNTNDARVGKSDLSTGIVSSFTHTSGNA